VRAAPLRASVAARGIKLKRKPALASRRAVNVAAAALPSPHAKRGFLHPLPLTVRSMATFPHQIPQLCLVGLRQTHQACSDQLVINCSESPLSRGPDFATIARNYLRAAVSEFIT
jgi:hypothetical protein